jgi:hypothetical protein
MITLFGLKVSYEALVFFALFLGSEVIGASKLKDNSIAQVLLSLVSYLKVVRKEDDKIQQVKNIFKG